MQPRRFLYQSPPDWILFCFKEQPRRGETGIRIKASGQVLQAQPGPEGPAPGLLTCLEPWMGAWIPPLQSH